jgi:hypothetical protein
MNLFCGAGLIIATLVLSAPAQAKRDLVDLRQIGHVASKGRVQDQQLPVVEALIKAGPAAVPFLVSKIEDRTPLPGRGTILDFWPRVEVGHVAFMVLCDLFTRSDGQTPTVAGLDWNHVLERPGDDLPAWELYVRSWRNTVERGSARRSSGYSPLIKSACCGTPPSAASGCEPERTG